MATHVLKTDAEAFQASWDEVKPFEVRFDDRNYEVGDNLILVETLHTGDEMREGKPLVYTGRWLAVCVMYKLKGEYGLKEGWCILGTAVEMGEEYQAESSEFAALLSGNNAER